jgi:hypothetical protein
MSDIEKVTCASPSLAHEPSPAPAAGSACGITADDYSFLEKQVDQITDVLHDHGYLDDAQTPAEAVREMAADAAEAQRAREVLYADDVLDEEYDLAQALREATHLAAEHQQILELLCQHDITTGGEPLPEAVKTLLSTAAEAEQACELLLDDGRTCGAEDVPEAVGQLITESAEVRALLIDSGLLDWNSTPAEALRRTVDLACDAHAAWAVVAPDDLMAEADGLSDAVRDVVAKADLLRQTQQELVEMEEQSINRGQRYNRERQYRVNVAAVASRFLLRVHAESHTGSVAACPTCGPDWRVVQEASGIRAPGN